MRKIVFVLACVACVGHGRRARHLGEHSRRNPELERHTTRELAQSARDPIALERVLQTFKPTDAFNPSGMGRKLHQSSPSLAKHRGCIRAGERGPSMALKTGIVGMPNVGKSTLFNALMQEAQAQAANFPFCTIDPNVGVVAVPDKRLDKLVELNKSEKRVPTSLSFVDIAGLVAGASKGEGLGNKFLSNIRECDAIVHVVRCFEDDNIIHVDGSVDPVRDIETISTELALADIDQVERRLEKLVKEVKSKKTGAEAEQKVLLKIQEKLNAGEPARNCDLSEDELATIKNFGLLTLKPLIYATNVADSELAGGNENAAKVKALADSEGAGTVLVSAQVEAELVDLDEEERTAFLEDLGVDGSETGLEKLIAEAYKLLGLRTYFTSGEQESKAWTIKNGMLAPQAAGVIHSDFERGFIRAETIAYDDYVAAGSEKAAKEAGTWRSEGKEYEVQEGDVILFRFNV